MSDIDTHIMHKHADDLHYVTVNKVQGSALAKAFATKYPNDNPITFSHNVEGGEAEYTVDFTPLYQKLIDVTKHVYVKHGADKIKEIAKAVSPREEETEQKISALQDELGDAIPLQEIYDDYKALTQFALQRHQGTIDHLFVQDIDGLADHYRLVDDPQMITILVKYQLYSETHGQESLPANVVKSAAMKKMSAQQRLQGAQSLDDELGALAEIIHAEGWAAASVDSLHTSRDTVSDNPDITEDLAQLNAMFEYLEKHPLNEQEVQEKEKAIRASVVDNFFSSRDSRAVGMKAMKAVRAHKQHDGTVKALPSPEKTPAKS